MKLPNFRLFWLPFLLFGVAAYAVPPEEESAPAIDPALKVRVDEYWAAVRAADWATTYRMESKAQGVDDPLDVVQYYNVKKVQPRHVKVKIEAIQQDGDRAVVKEKSLVLKSLAGGASVRNIFYTESEWVRQDGIWLHVQSKRYTPEHVRERREEAALQAEKARQESEAVRADTPDITSESAAAESDMSEEPELSPPDSPKQISPR